MAELLDNCRFTAGSTGTADFADGEADPSFRNLEDAGAEDGKTYPYKAQNATGTEWEIGRGTALNTSGGWILERTSIQDSSNGGSKVNFGTQPKVFITAGKAEFWRHRATQYITASGTWTNPGAKRIRVTVIGGGGGGGGAAGGANRAAGGGGGEGGMSIKEIDVSAISTVSVTIGAGGNGGAAGANNGSTGGTTSFGAHCSATGGVGGFGSGNFAAANFLAGGDGGMGSGGDFNVPGQPGGFGARGETGPRSGTGGGRGANGVSNDADGINAVAPGAGGSGAAALTTSRAGGNGADGIVVVEYLE